MKRLILCTLAAVALSTPAHADHVWRLWCGTPSTARQGAYDSSQECYDRIGRLRYNSRTYCRDTKAGPRWIDGDRIRAWDEFATCAALRADDATCHCVPEAL